LLESQGRLIEKDEFLSRLWPDSSVEEVALAHCISHLRKALLNGTGDERSIETVPKRGYRFVAAIEIIRPVADENSTVVRVAVLPFENLGAGPEREYLADGLTEETIATIGQIDPITSALSPHLRHALQAHHQDARGDRPRARCLLSHREFTSS